MRKSLGSKGIRKAVLLFVIMSLCTTFLVLGAGMGIAPGTPVDAKLNALRTRGDRLIERRVKFLEGAMDRLEGAVRISDEDKNSLKDDLQTNIDGLNELKTKIDAETDLETLRGEVRSIITDFRIFMVVLPRDRGLFASARCTYAIGKLESAVATLESAINTLKSSGKDTAEVEGFLATLKNDIANAKSDVDQAKSTFSSMTPERYTEAGTLRNNGIEFLRAARTNLRDAAKQARKIIDWLQDNS